MYVQIVFFLQDECSFVSLRDVERVLEVMSWFYNQRDNELLFQQMNTDFEEYDSELDEEDEDEERQPVCMLMFYSYIEVKD